MCIMVKLLKEGGGGQVGYKNSFLLCGTGKKIIIFYLNLNAIIIVLPYSMQNNINLVPVGALSFVK